jgi:hypothetical protein
LKILLATKGVSLAEINPGSTEFALKANDALVAVKVAEDHKLPILGEDILAIKDGVELAYAYQLWGNEYQYLEWYCDKRDDETDLAYAKRSYSEAKDAIDCAAKVVTKLGGQPYIVLAT